MADPKKGVKAVVMIPARNEDRTCSYECPILSYDGSESPICAKNWHVDIGAYDNIAPGPSCPLNQQDKRVVAIEVPKPVGGECSEDCIRYGGCGWAILEDYMGHVRDKDGELWEEPFDRLVPGPGCPWASEEASDE